MSAPPAFANAGDGPSRAASATEWTDAEPPATLGDWESIAEMASENLRLEIESGWTGLRGEVTRAIDDAVRDAIAAAVDRASSNVQRQQREARELLERLRLERERMLTDVEDLRREAQSIRGEVNDRRQSLAELQRQARDAEERLQHAKRDAEAQKTRLLQDVENLGHRLESMRLDIAHLLNLRASTEAVVESFGAWQASAVSPTPVPDTSQPRATTSDAGAIAPRPDDVASTRPTAASASTPWPISTAPTAPPEPLTVVARPEPATEPAVEPVSSGTPAEPATADPDPLADLPEPPPIEDDEATDTSNVGDLLGYGGLSAPETDDEDKADEPAPADDLADLTAALEEEPEIEAAPTSEPIVTTLRISNVSGLAHAMQIARAIRGVDRITVQGAPRFQNGILTLSVQHALGLGLGSALTSSPGVRLDPVNVSSLDEMEFALAG